MLTYPGITTTPGSTKAPYLTVPGGTTRTPAAARSFLVGILSLYSKGPARVVRISAITKYRLIAFITHALERHSPSLFRATRNSPLSRAATASKTAARYSSASSSLLSSKAASIFSCVSGTLARIAFRHACFAGFQHACFAGLSARYARLRQASLVSTHRPAASLVSMSARRLCRLVRRLPPVGGFEHDSIFGGWVILWLGGCDGARRLRFRLREGPGWSCEVSSGEEFEWLRWLCSIPYWGSGPG